MTNLPEYDTICRCAVCGREEQVLLAAALQQGLPQCHGQEMAITQTWADVSRSFDQALNPMTRRAAQALSARLKKRKA